MIPGFHFWNNGEYLNIQTIWFWILLAVGAFSALYTLLVLK